MLYLFGPKETDFVNGDSDLIHNTYDEVVERAKGFYLKFKMTLDKDEQYKKVKKEMIISAYTPDGWNQFRVFDIYNYSNHVEVVATQLHYDLNYKKVYPFNARNVTAQAALNLFVSKFKSDLPNFKFTSSIDKTRNFSTDDDLERLDEGHNALEVLNRMAARWGGELDVNGYNVRLVPKLGKFTNALLYEHKNISEFVDETSLSEVITRIHAVTRFRPERVEGSEDEPEEVTIKVVVDSPLINEYAQVYEEDYTNNDARTKAELVAWARLKYSTNSVDKPARSIKVETNIIDGQEINYGDDLVLKYTKHDVDEIIRCVGYQYNPNSKQYISVTLGSNTKTLSTTITGAVHNSTRNQFSNMEKQVQAVRYAANDRNRATTGPLPVPNPIEGDIWYYHPEGRPNEVELRIYQNGGWETIVNDLTGENIRKTIDDMELEAEALAGEIAASDQKAAEALAEAGISNDLAQTAKDLATTAKSDANTAKTNATNALAEARESATNAIGALALAGQAATDSKTAIDTAKGAQTDAQTAISNAATAQSDAQTAIDDAKTAQTDAQSALSKASGAESSVSTLSKEVDTVAGKVALKADQTEVDTVKGTVSTNTTTLSQHATAISSKAESELVNKIKGTVDTHTTEISQNATAITSKASQKEVDTVKGTVGTHTTTLSQHATSIASKAEKSVVDTLSGTVTDQGTSISQNATDIASKANTKTVNTLTGRVDKTESNISQNAKAITQRVTTTTYNTGLGTKENSVLKRSTAPAHLNGRLWLDTSVTPNVLKRSTGTAWVKATPTTPSEVGAYSSGQGSALAGRVSTAETNITQTSKAITSKADKSVVDTLSGTVSTHTTKITQNATAISSKAAQTEVDTVKGTVSKHTSTLSQQAKDISARLTQTQVNNLVSEKGYSTVSYVDAEMTATAKAIRTEMTAVEGKIPTYVGGRNLILGSSKPITLPPRNTGGAGDNYNYTRLKAPMKKGETYTLSFNLEITHGAFNKVSVYPQYGHTQSTVHVDLVNNRGVCTFKAVADTDDLITFVYAGVAGATRGNGFVMTEYQLEKGSVATDWTPAPEDMLKQNDFNTFKAEYEQSAKGWSAKLLEIEQADYASKTWSNKTFATPQSITTQLKSYAKTTDLNGLATESYVSTKISTTAKAIRTELTAVENKMPTEIGGPNLIKDSGTPITIAPRNSGASVDNYAMAVLKAPMTKGETYTISFDVEITHGDFNQVSLFTQTPQMNPVTVDLVNNRGRYTFTAWKDADPSTMQVFAGLQGKTRGNGMILKNYKLGKGTITTDWLPAPEDMVTDLNGLATETYASNVAESKASGVSQSLTKIIDTKATQSDIDTSILNDKRIKDTRNDNKLPSWYRTNYPRQTVSEFKFTKVMEITEGSTYGILTTEVQWGDPSGGKVKQTFKDDSTTYVRRSNNNYTAWEPWVKMADQTYVNTTIKTTAEGIEQLITSVKTNPTGTITGYNSLKNNVDSMVQAIGSDGGKIAQIVLTNSTYQTTVANLDIMARVGTGQQLYSDPLFIKGTNGIGVYNNAGGTHVKITRESASGDPTPTNNRLKIVTNGSTVKPGWGGIIRNTTGRVKAEYVIMFTALLPKGRRFQYAENPLGKGYTSKWLTSPDGTGDWAEYAYYYKCGTGTVSSFGHLYVQGGATPTAAAPLTWYLAKHETYDISGSFQTQVTQLADSWALTLKSGNDIKTAINATTNGIRLQGKTIRLDGNTLMDNAFARSLIVDKLQAADITAFTGKFHKIIANNLDVNNISGTKSAFLESAWTGLNSRAYVDSRRIRIESGTRGAYVELNNIPEFRSQYHDGTGVVMAKGRVQFFEPNGGSQGYMGRDIHTGTNDFGIFISRGKGWRLARATDKSSSTGDKYYTVKSGMTDRVGIIEDMVRRRILPDGNTQNFINNSNKIARLNGWPILPQPWPTQRVGDQILYEKGKIVNEGATGVSYEDVMNFGKNGARTDWWLYMRQHVRFEAGYTSASDRRIKHNIQSTDIVALNEIESLDMVQFNMNSDGRYVPLGLIAQEAGILRVPDEKNEGINVELATMLSLKGVQELYHRIKELEEEVKTLKENDA